MNTTAPTPESYLVIFYIVIIGCVACVGYGIFQLIRYYLGHRHGTVEATVEFDKLKARLAQSSPSLVGLHGIPEVPDVEGLNADAIQLQGQELLQTEEGQQALALLRVEGIVSMSDRFWVNKVGQVYTFTKTPDGNRPPAWLVRVDTEKVEAVPAGVSVEAAVTRMNSANSQPKPDDSPAPLAD